MSEITPYKGFDIVTSETLKPWGPQEYGAQQSYIDTLLGRCYDPQKNALHGHKHFYFYDNIGNAIIRGDITTNTAVVSNLAIPGFSIAGFVRNDSNGLFSTAPLSLEDLPVTVDGLSDQLAVFTGTNAVGGSNFHKIFITSFGIESGGLIVGALGPDPGDGNIVATTAVKTPSITIDNGTALTRHIGGYFDMTMTGFIDGVIVNNPTAACNYEIIGNICIMKIPQMTSGTDGGEDHTLTGIPLEIYSHLNDSAHFASIPLTSTLFGAVDNPVSGGINYKNSSTWNIILTSGSWATAGQPEASAVEGFPYVCTIVIYLDA